MAPPPDPPEIALSAAWHAGEIPARLATVGGERVEIVHRGRWSHGLGPDFADAMLLFEGRELRTGGVEIHLRTRGWTEHRHHLDPRYDAVVLHVVLRDDGAPTRRRDGALVPVADLSANGWSWSGAPAAPASVWDRFGGESCAEVLAGADPAGIVEALRRLGDRRLATKAARLEAALTALPPAEALYREVWDGLGYSANREPMRLLAERLPLAAVEAKLAAAPDRARVALARGLLFGVAGFLPLAPSDAALAGLVPEEVAETEAAWSRHGQPWHAESLPPTAWTRARVRPANHPAARLAAGAALLASTSTRGGLVAALLAPLHTGADGVSAVRDLAGGRLGADRATAIVTNALLPFALALAEQAGEPALADAAAAALERLPAVESNERSRRALRQVAGGARLPRLGARGVQGLLHLDAAFCAPRRCFECPIAGLVLADDARRSAIESRPIDEMGNILPLPSRLGDVP